MDSILLYVHWSPVVVGAIAAWVLGGLWFSPKMFGKKWMDAIGISETDKAPMAHAMLAQALGTFLLAWIIGVAVAANSLHMAILVAFTIAVLIKANGLFAKKKKPAIIIETTYVFAMVAVMIIAHAIL